MIERIVVAETTFYKTFETKDEAIEHIKSGKAMTREINLTHYNIGSIYPPDRLKDAYEKFYKLLRDDENVSTIEYSPYTKDWLTKETIVSVAQISVNECGEIINGYTIIKGNTKKRFY